MRYINNYITEKLHLRHGVERNDLLGQYNIGDVCMLVTYVPAKTSSRTKEPSFVAVDVVEIMKDTGISFILKYLTNTGHTCKEKRCSFNYTYQIEGNIFSKNNKFIESFFANGKTDLSFRSFLVSPDSCKDIYDYIVNNDRKLCYHLAVQGNYSNPKGYHDKSRPIEVYIENMVCTPYYGKSSLTWKNVCGVDKTNLDKIKNALGL